MVTPAHAHETAARTGTQGTRRTDRPGLEERRRSRATLAEARKQLLSQYHSLLWPFQERREVQGVGLPWPSAFLFGAINKERPFHVQVVV